jgi:thiamine biosynthesis lipoprotein
VVKSDTPFPESRRDRISASESPLSQLRRGDIDIYDAPALIGEVLQLCNVSRTISGRWFDPWTLPGGVDPTGLVKGWAAQRALAALPHNTIDGAIVTAAGDITSIGWPAASGKFRVGIANPANPRSLACVVESPGAVATSGSYERGQHLFDPRRGIFKTNVASGTVVGPKLALTDALATALVVGGTEVLDILENVDNFEGMIIDNDGNVLTTTGFPVVQWFDRTRGIDRECFPGSALRRSVSDTKTEKRAQTNFASPDHLRSGEANLATPHHERALHNSGQVDVRTSYSFDGSTFSASSK